MSTEQALALRIISMILKTKHEAKALNAHATAMHFDELLENIIELCQQDITKQNEEFVTNSILGALRARFPWWCRFSCINGEYIVTCIGVSKERVEEIRQEVNAFIAILNGKKGQEPQSGGQQ